MNVLIDQFVQSVLQKQSLRDCNIQEIKQLADQYPYFGMAHLLLAEKLKTENSALSNEKLQKASLFFYNPLWLDHLINDTGKAEINSTQKTESATAQENKSGPDEIVMESSSLPVEQSEIKKQADNMVNSEFTFEPFHTVDYFASQGIKFKPEEIPKDKFGQQLKSFTEWLKTLKRSPVAEESKSADMAIEQKVEQLAIHSIADRDVVTEAMAEVWEKQGNSIKAIEIYEKLSLLNPSKSSYFAARIEQIKKTS